MAFVVVSCGALVDQEGHCGKNKSPYSQLGLRTALRFFFNTNVTPNHEPHVGTYIDVTTKEASIPRKKTERYAVRQAVREWLYHDDHDPPQAGAVSPGLQERRRLAAAAEARAAFGTNDHATYDPGEPNSPSGGSLRTANDGAGGVDQRAVLRHLMAASHGNRGNSGGSGDSNPDRAAERVSDSHSGRSSSELSSGGSLELSFETSYELYPTNR